MSNSDLTEWVGRTATVQDVLTTTPARSLAATLDREELDFGEGSVLPPLWHWLYFLPSERQSLIGPDGHPRRGGFLPPVALPRRMWAGGCLHFNRPFKVGSAVQRVSRIDGVTRKSGRSGELVFVRVRHDISDAEGIALTEEHDIVYRGNPTVGDAAVVPQAARTDEQFSRKIVPDPVLLFRYSALTFNGHRIHYDQPYATQVEGYPGLIVHGPLIATLLIEQLQREQPSAHISAFEFKAMSPLFDIAAFEVCGRIDGDLASLWARGPNGELAMQAEARIG
nr:MaoC family dehydratase N-terminal domain-containing protein [uncultured Albidiferax sp.]